MKRLVSGVWILGLIVGLFFLTQWESSHRVREVSAENDVVVLAAPVNASTAVSVPLPRLDALPAVAVSAQEEKWEGQQKDFLRAATEFLESHREEWELRDYHEFHPEVFQDPLLTTVKFRVTQDQIPVQGMEIVIEIDAEKNATLARKEYRPLAKAELDGNVLGIQEVIQKNSESFLMETAPEGEARSLMAPEGSDEPVLVYGVSAHEKNGAGRPVYVLFRASDGQPMSRSYTRAEFRHPAAR